VWVRVPSLAPKGLHKIDAPTENPDKIGVFAVFTVKKHKGRMTGENRSFQKGKSISFTSAKSLVVFSGSIVITTGEAGGLIKP